MKHIFSIAMALLLFNSMVLASDIIVTLPNGNTISFPYCWKKGDQIRFDAPGGVVGLNMSDLKTIEERIIHSDVDSQYLISTAIPKPPGEPFVILKDYIARKRGISINTSDRVIPKPSLSVRKTPSTGDAKLISPVTKAFESFTQAFKEPKGEKILIGVFANSREELEGRKCSVKFIDLDRKNVAQESLTIVRLMVSEEEQAKNKISPLFYLIYGVIQPKVEFWAYDVVCEISM